MAWIETSREDEWTGRLADLYPEVVDKAHGRVDNIMQIHSLNTKGMAAHNTLYRSAMAGTAGLRKVERELIALLVSNINKCDY